MVRLRMTWVSGITTVVTLIVTFVGRFQSTEAKVLEMSDKFVSVRGEGMWLVKFYAPWCGHCKMLEPVWKHVEQSLSTLPLKVGRIDCTRFPSVATEFQIYGYPTIIFFKGDSRFTYDGDRNKEDLIAFAKRLIGPPVTQIYSHSDFNAAKGTSDIFFLFAGEENGMVWESYFRTANLYQQQESFYSAPAELAEKFSGEKETQTIRVYKDSTSYKFEEALPIEDASGERVHRSLSDRKDESAPELEVEKSTSNSLFEWVDRERFPLFVKVTRGRLNRLMSTKKLLVMAVLKEDRVGQLSSDMEDFRAMIKTVLGRNADRYRAHFQFGWTGAPELANSVAMQELQLPNLIVVNATSYQHYLPQDDPSRLTAEATELFLDQVVNGSARAYGGSSFYVRTYRAYFEMAASITEMWRGNPALTAVLFGLPLGFFALICYSICCVDIMDAEEEDEEENLVNAVGGSHEKMD